MNLPPSFIVKVNSLLEKLLDVQQKTRVDEELNKLLTYLWWEDKSEEKPTICIFMKWLSRAVTSWTEKAITPPTSIMTFSLSLASLLTRSESRFNNLNRDNFFIKLVKLSEVQRHQSSDSLKLACIKLLSSFLNHSSGFEWMLACNFWEYAINWCLTNSEDEVVNESTRFIIAFLEQAVAHDDFFCDTIIKKIMFPLDSNIFRSIKSSSSTDDIAYHHILPALKLIENILHISLQKVYLGDKDFGVLLIFLKNFYLENRVNDFILIAQKVCRVDDFILRAQKACLSFTLTKLMFMMQFVELYSQIITNSISFGKVSATITRIQSNFMTKLYKGTYEELMDFCKFSLFYWRLMLSKIPIRIEGSTDFSDKFLVFFLLPTFCVELKFLFKKRSHVDVPFDRDLFVEKLWNMITNGFARMLTIWRTWLIDHPNILRIAFHSLDILKQSLGFITRGQAIVIFQVFVFTLDDVNCVCTHFPDTFELFYENVSYIVKMIELVGELIKDFRPVLRDCIECTYVIDVCCNFLRKPGWPLDFIVKILDLLNIAIRHYMIPMMALLLGNKSDLLMLGPLLEINLKDKRYEVRRAALEIVSTVASLSSEKFPSLQKVLMDSELPTLVVKMSTFDGESFVRTTAIKCLQEMIQVEEIWNNALKSEDLTQKMYDILLNETEGIVRVEAATFMCVAYEHQQFPKDSLDRIYKTMIYSSTTDLHWEVRVRSLSFWDKVIKNHLQNQGMIDGTFPSITFSKEHRKIVTLTDSEIRKRLLKVLSQLSTIGCLGVLVSAIKDDCNMEVSKTAVKITQRLIDLFKKYNVRPDDSIPTSPLPTVSMSSGISVNDDAMDSLASAQPDFNEEIIDQIGNPKDVNLLKNVYAPSDYSSLSNYYIQIKKVVTPNEFLEFTQQDLNVVISEKKTWLNRIEDLGSLLDDMLKTYDEDVNNMACHDYNNMISR